MQQILCVAALPLSSQLISKYTCRPWGTVSIHSDSTYHICLPLSASLPEVLALGELFNSSSGQLGNAQDSTLRKHSSIKEGQHSVDKYFQLSHFLVGKFWAAFYNNPQSVPSRSEPQSPIVHPSTHLLLAFLLFILGPLFKYIT